MSVLTRESCGREYAHGAGKRCERPKGHREDSTSVWSDPLGCHLAGGVTWTNGHSRDCPACQAREQTDSQERSTT